MTEFFSKYILTPIENNKIPFVDNLQKDSTQTDAEKNKNPLLFNFNSEKKDISTPITNTIKKDNSSVFDFGKNPLNFSFEKYVTNSQENGLKESIPGWYVLKDNEARAEVLSKHLSKFENPKAQYDEFNRLLSQGITKDDVEILANTLKDLKNGVRIDAAETMLKNDKLSNEVKRHSDDSVTLNVKKMPGEDHECMFKMVMENTGQETKELMATETHKLYEPVQEKAVDYITAMGNEKVTNALASVTHEFKKDSLKFAKKIFNTGFETVQKTLAINEGKYEKEYQLDLHRMVNTSKYQSVLNESSNSIHTLEKSNQYEATQITIAGGNEEAINVAASKHKYCDESVQSKIATSLNNSGYASVQQTVANAPAPRIASSTSGATTVSAGSAGSAGTTGSAGSSATYATAATSTATNSNVAANMSYSFGNNSAQSTNNTSNSSLVSQINTIIASSSPTRDEDIRKLLANTNDTQKLELMNTLPKNLIVTVIKMLLDQSPSPEVLNKISSMAGDIKGDIDKKEVMDKLKECYPKELLASRMQDFDITFQSLYIEKAAYSGDLGAIKTDKLSSVAREKYKKLFRENNKRNENGKVA